MSQVSQKTVKWTIHDLELLADDEWKHYEIIDGELFVTRAPHWNHQDASGNIYFELQAWSRVSKLGKAALTPGLIFSDSDNVEPDVIWIGYERLAILLDESGHLTGSPELVVEVLSPGNNNEKRDKEAKLKLYSTRGVQEYWIVNWQLQTVEIYRREQEQLKLKSTLTSENEIGSPILPEFSCQVKQFFN